jgi:hypothetical protein
VSIIEKRRAAFPEKLGCTKCMRESVTILPSCGGTSTTYDAVCDAGCGIVVADMPSDADGGCVAATADYKHEVKRTALAVLKAPAKHPEVLAEWQSVVEGSF